ncbi:MAG: alpha/beta hydrolase [Solirubrobacteraceae bacterium]|nr:alpha/beta hydrolase [Solirubrobacteraceae bacterium]
MFTFDVEPEALFEERTGQFGQCGIPRAAIAQARAAITDMWSMERGGWVPEWGRLAQDAEARGDALLGAQLWGAARFPSLATDDRLDVYDNQLAAYLRAAEAFPVPFERRIFALPSTRLTAHLFGRPRRGVLVVSGGVDTWKVELHRLMVLTARMTGLLVVAIDMPGTGESELALGPGAETVLIELTEALRREHGRKVGYLGLSFGGHWAVKLAALGAVDAAVDIGGPTGASGETIDVLNLPYGMAGIIGNALGLDAMPTPEYVNEQLGAYDLRELLSRSGRSPLLAINGAQDQYIPPGDTSGLAGPADTRTWLVRNATHCAPERFPLVVLRSWAWLRRRLA